MSQHDEAQYVDGRQSDAALDIQRGVMRLMRHSDRVPLTELTLITGRRADVVGLGRSGEIVIVEVKSSLADFRSDTKWQEYADHCDRFYFAVAPDFPLDVLPDDVGLIIADRYSAEIVREAVESKLPAARRKNITLRMARVAAARLHGLVDPDMPDWRIE